MMWYFRIEGDNRKFGNIKYARKAAIETGRGEVTIYEGNVVGEWKAGVIRRRDGKTIYVTDQGTWRISKSGDARKVDTVPAPFGL